MSVTESPSPRKATTLDQLRAKRLIEGVESPAGLTYTIRPINLQRHALTGNLPTSLRQAAMRGVEGINSFFAADEETLTQAGEEVRGYLDALVAEVIYEPCLYVGGERANGDEGGIVDPEAIELIPPVDYKWALEIAFLEEDRDGQGRLMWGVERLSRFERFRHRHNCPEDCAGCEAVRRDFSYGVE